MNICFYAPFKPLDHAHPSGDLVTGRGICDFLQRRGHTLTTASRLRCRWIYWRPVEWPRLPLALRQAQRRCAAAGARLWFTYHSYYKAPDVVGPLVSRRLGIPYAVFQGIYSTKRRRRLKTLPGFYLNRWALRRASHVFANKELDLHNLRRLLPADRLSYVAPGLHPSMFTRDDSARAELRRRWRVGDDPVVLSVAMFRPGVKSLGLRWVIRTCGKLLRSGRRLRLVIVGDGQERDRLQRLARDELGGRVDFAGHIPRERLFRYYSAADLFVFPGIDESLGMVYLEAQACGLPVVAFRNAGVPEAVRHGVTGLLVPLNAAAEFAAAIEGLLANADARRRMGRAAAGHIRRAHDLDRNYLAMERVLQELA